MCQSQTHLEDTPEIDKMSEIDKAFVRMKAGPFSAVFRQGLHVMFTPVRSK